MKLRENIWLEITDPIGQKFFIFVDSVVSETSVVYDCEIYDFNAYYLNECEIKEWFPSYNQYCWFYNDGDFELGISPHIGRYESIGTSYTKDFYDVVEPFCDRLPYGLIKYDYKQK